MAGRGGNAGAQAVKQHRLLAIATLYPNLHTPRFGTFVARSLEALAARDDWDVTVINPIGLPPIHFGRYRSLATAAVHGTENGVRIFRPAFPLIPKLSGRFNPALIARSIMPLACQLHAEKPFHIVDAQFFYPDGPAAARIAAALDLPLSIKARGADISYWGGKAHALRQMLSAGNQATGLLAVSEALARDMVDIGLPNEKIAVHYTGLDRSRFYPRDRALCRAQLEERFGISAEGPLLATVGALIPRKAQALVIEALTALPGAQLALVGTGPDLGTLQSLAHRLSLADRVYFLGSLDHDAIADLLVATDAMVLPSQSEGLANAWVEALACGAPLVISDAGGAHEIMRDPSAGAIAQRNPQGIAEAIRTVLRAGHSPLTVAENAAHFSWETHAETLASNYAGLIAD